LKTELGVCFTGHFAPPPPDCAFPISLYISFPCVRLYALCVEPEKQSRGSVCVWRASWCSRCFASPRQRFFRGEKPKDFQLPQLKSNTAARAQSRAVHRRRRGQQERQRREAQTPRWRTSGTGWATRSTSGARSTTGTAGGVPPVTETTESAS
jgi:hypothetical protein